MLPRSVSKGTTESESEECNYRSAIGANLSMPQKQNSKSQQASYKSIRSMKAGRRAHYSNQNSSIISIKYKNDPSNPRSNPADNRPTATTMSTVAEPGRNADGGQPSRQLLHTPN